MLQMAGEACQTEDQITLCEGPLTIVAEVDDAARQQDDDLVEELEGLRRGRVDRGADRDAVHGPCEGLDELHHLPRSVRIRSDHIPASHTRLDRCLTLKGWVHLMQAGTNRSGNTNQVLFWLHNP